MVQMSHDAVPSQTDETVRWIEETVAFFLPISIEADSMNIGHVVHEDIVPLMHLANLFGVALESVRVLWHSSLARWAGDLEKLRGEVERIIRDFYAALVRIPPEFLEDFWRQEQSISPSLNRLCFRHLIAGASWMKSIHGVGDYRFLSPLLREVRMKVYNHHGLQNLGRMDIPPVPFRDQRKVLVIRKSGGMRTRSMQNIDEVAEWTREILNERVVRESGYSATVSVFDWKSVRAGGLKEELGVWSSVDILITPCGGVSMLGFFMRPGAQMIVMDHLEDDSRYAKSMSMEKMIWEALPWMSVQFYQIINRTDLVLPPEAWEDVDKHPERAHPVFRNEANVMVQKGRLRLLVLNAVERLRTFETRLLE
uniref:Glycosyltransferase 61 catalytic domain-containing protein n=1 Tax=Chromera velia CCMP2878 TaxID=1169474 RepID=A0A0G4G6A5_9ALVE|eukprot:Cvel_4243.t1-p1 / transcript=Cvel_4243.t1 / gene=Cvel_4243 / organism=Chromera_velia_CCMP2878 / gene_product=hypothetical protein / transcript_product=hypothetical protein / location=Cvel_scaffold183:112422-113519(-) / protein_length=366 / sequence_SO=supercontig / SO=protein_coding / is_pseudo=false